MIPVDCIPKNEHETIMEITDGPNRYGQYTFFLYWIGTGHFTGVRGQIFLADPAQYKHNRIIDRRKR
jgi:hypothetical protein